MRLTPKEFELLRQLVSNQGVSLSHRRLLQAVWGPDYGEETEYLRVFINQLRKKIEPDPRHLATFHRSVDRYRFEPHPENAAPMRKIFCRSALMGADACVQLEIGRYVHWPPRNPLTLLGVVCYEHAHFVLFHSRPRHARNLKFLDAGEICGSSPEPDAAARSRNCIPHSPRKSLHAATTRSTNALLSARDSIHRKPLDHIQQAPQPTASNENIPLT
jgi:hypothetical protein